MTYTLQNWSKIFFDRPIILGTSFSDFAENYQFFAIFIQTRPGIKNFYFSDPNYFEILYLFQKCHLSRPTGMAYRSKKSIFWEIFNFPFKMKFWLIKFSMKGGMLCISMPRIFLDFSPNLPSRTVYEPEVKNHDFLQTTLYLNARSAQGLRDSERRTPMSEPTLNSGNFG